MHSFKSVYVYPPSVAKKCSRVTIHHPRFISMPLLSDNQVKLLFIPTYLMSLANMNAVHFIIICWLDTSNWVQQLQIIGWAGRSKSQSPIEKRSLVPVNQFLVNQRSPCRRVRDTPEDYKSPRFPDCAACSSLCGTPRLFVHFTVLVRIFSCDGISVGADTREEVEAE